jgi:CHAD domain-containing protein
MKGYEEEFLQVKEFLREAFRLNPRRDRELVLCLKALGRVPGGYSSRFRKALDGDKPAVDATTAILNELLKTIRVNHPGVLKDLDPEFLHDFRVAVRRTRSALTQIKGVFPPARAEHFRSEFRWLGSRTGPARDLDVYLLKIPSYRSALPADVADHLNPLVEYLERRKGIEHRKLVRTLRSKRYAELVEDWTGFLQETHRESPDSPNALRPAKEVASERILKACRKVLKRGAAITDASPAEELHELRIDCKKLRYLILFFHSLYPPESLGPLVKELKKLQDNLGDLNDLHFQREALRGSAETMMAERLAPPETLMAMGRLMGQLEVQESKEREAFRQWFKRFSRPKNRRRFSELFGEDCTAPREG